MGYVGTQKEIDEHIQNLLEKDYDHIDTVYGRMGGGVRDQVQVIVDFNGEKFMKQIHFDNDTQYTDDGEIERELKDFVRIHRIEDGLKSKYHHDPFDENILSCTECHRFYSDPKVLRGECKTCGGNVKLWEKKNRITEKTLSVAKSPRERVLIQKVWIDTMIKEGDRHKAKEEVAQALNEYRARYQRIKEQRRSP